MSKKRSEFIDWDGEPVFINTQLQVTDGQKFKMGFLHHIIDQPEKPKRKRAVKRKKGAKAARRASTSRPVRAPSRG
jgi:hypothetical protein